MSNSFVLLTALWMQAGEELAPVPLIQPLTSGSIVHETERKAELERLEDQLRDLSERIRQLTESQPTIIFQVQIAEVPESRVAHLRAALDVLADSERPGGPRRLTLIEPRMGQALLAAVDATIISRPQVRTLDGQLAVVQTNAVAHPTESDQDVRQSRDLEIQLTPCLLPNQHIACQIVQKTRETTVSDVTTVDVRQRETAVHADLVPGKTYLLTETASAPQCLVVLITSSVDQPSEHSSATPRPSFPTPIDGEIHLRVMPRPVPALPPLPAPPVEQPQATRGRFYLLPLTRIIPERNGVRTAVGTDAEDAGVGPH